MPPYDIEVFRDGRWWMIRVPSLEGYVHPDGSINRSDLTQAESEDEIEYKARDFIGTVLDEPYESIQVKRRPT